MIGTEVGRPNTKVVQKSFATLAINFAFLAVKKAKTQHLKPNT